MRSSVAAKMGTQPSKRKPGDLERLLFEHSRDGMLLISVELDQIEEPRFCIQAENPAAVAYLGSLCNKTTFAGENIATSFPTWLLKQTIGRYRACIEKRGIQRYEIIQPNGSVGHESIATPIMGADGKTVEYIVVVMRDIGERLVQEKRLNIALAKAEQAVRSKSEFFASMSHELRTPLNAIIGFSEVMESGIGGSLSERHRQYIENIHSSGQHLLEIISDILDLTKIEAGQFKLQEVNTSIPHLIETCMLMLRERALQKTLKLSSFIQPDLPLFNADPLRIKQILLNLLVNAIKFTDKGSVTLSASFDHAGGFSFAVTDTGIGMTLEEITIALEPFGQVEDAYTRNRDGTGLGLPIAKQLTEIHGGHLILTSTKFIGTCAKVVFPPTKAASSTLAEKPLHVA